MTEIDRDALKPSLGARPTGTGAGAAATARGTTADAPAAHRRPRSLQEVLRWGQRSGDTDSFLREFLDEFYLEPDADARAAMLADEPPLVAYERGNAYLAAVAEHLALRHRLPIPEWTRAKCRFLNGRIIRAAWNR